MQAGWAVYHLGAQGNLYRLGHCSSRMAVYRFDSLRLIDTIDFEAHPHLLSYVFLSDSLLLFQQRYYGSDSTLLLFHRSGAYRGYVRHRQPVLNVVRGPHAFCYGSLSASGGERKPLLTEWGVVVSLKPFKHPLNYPASDTACPHVPLLLLIRPDSTTRLLPVYFPGNYYRHYYSNYCYHAYVCQGPDPDELVLTFPKSDTLLVHNLRTGHTRKHRVPCSEITRFESVEVNPETGRHNELSERNLMDGYFEQLLYNPRLGLYFRTVVRPYEVADDGRPIFKPSRKLLQVIDKEFQVVHEAPLCPGFVFQGSGFVTPDGVCYESGDLVDRWRVKLVCVKCTPERH
jgi:hypothetical protein